MKEVRLLGKPTFIKKEVKDSNLHSTDHEPDELTITLPRFFPLSFIVVSPCKSMTFFSYDNTLPLYGLPELNKTGRKTSSGLGMIT
ncbi:hypothetical protein V6N13_035068 [Hibiscus sabdariffa]